MRLVIAGCVSVGLALCGCSSSRTAPTADLPLAVGHGAGSEFGNYVAQVAGEMRGPEGEHCVVFDWDRPLTKDRAVRVRSASCESKQQPGRMAATELSRVVIPLSQSNLKDERGEAGQ